METRPTEITIPPEPQREGYLNRLEVEREAQRKDEQGRTGVDPVTGLPKTYTAREIRNMSADQFKRAFFSGIAPTFRDLFIALSGNRGRQ